MADDTLLTLKQLADQLSLPESTVRYYRDAFIDHIPSVGTGRRRRYPQEAIAVLRSIARHYAAGQSRSEIIRNIEQGESRGSAVAVSPAKSQPARAVEEVSNLDLLAALLDGEREQRDALWQMAKEIVRLTEVLEGQDVVLSEIADRAGVVVSGGRPTLTRAATAAAPRIGAPAPPPAPAPVARPEAPPIAPRPPATSAELPTMRMPALDPALGDAASSRETAPYSRTLFGAAPFDAGLGGRPSSPAMGEPPAPAPPPQVTPTPAASTDIEKLRAELESERALVERLRESKLQLEHRVADAEATADDKRKSGRRSSVLKRFLGTDDTQ